MALLTSSLSVVRASADRADAWTLDPSQLLLAGIGLLAVPIAFASVGFLGRIAEAHLWLLLLVWPAPLLLGGVHTHVHIDGAGVVIRRRWLFITLKVERLALGGWFETPIQEQDRGQLYYSSKDAGSDGFGVSRASNLQTWLNAQSARLEAARPRSS